MWLAILRNILALGVSRKLKNDRTTADRVVWQFHCQAYRYVTMMLTVTHRH